MSRRRHRSSRAVTGVLLAALGGLGVLVAGCTDSSSGTTTPSPTESANAVADAFRLPDDVRNCLDERFGQSGEARRTLILVEEPSDRQRTALADVVEGCVSDEAFAAGIAASVGSALPPRDPGRAEAQATCVRDAVLDLSDDDRRTLLVGLLVQSTPLDGELALARGETVNSIFTSCEVDSGR